MSNRSEGITPTERFLARLSRRSFLSLWSHPNLFRDVAKELADLTVVCGEHVILFSDKNIGFNFDKDLKTAWSRWYNRAILQSAKQLIRAKGWIENHSDRVFYDAKCERHADLFKNIESELEIHLVAVANGASRACLEFFEGGSGGLVVSPEEPAECATPFCVGNPGGDKAFVHVFDEANLNVVLQELDTIADFLRYLQVRRRVFENRQLIQAPSEEDLLAIYLSDVNAYGEHDFVSESGKAYEDGQFFVVEEGSYLAYTKRAEYRRKKKADKKSYFWDSLIESFSKNFLNGTLAPLPDGLSTLDGRRGGAELGLRYMALEPRIIRRAHSEAILGAFHSLRNSKGDRFFRAMLPADISREKTGFFVLLVNRRGLFDDSSYDEYRRYRAMLAHAYSENLLLRHRGLSRVVGIATEGELGGGRSEDLIYQEQIVWDDETIAQTRELAEAFEVFRNEAERTYSALEYPETDLGLRGGFSSVPYRFYHSETAERPSHSTGNRAQRRAQKARDRRSTRK